MEFEQAMAFVKERWATRTLSDLKAEASKEANGTAFESFRTGDGLRRMLVMCITNQEQISMVEKIFDFDDTVPPSDWNSSTLLEFVARSQSQGGLGYEDIRDPAGNRTAIALCAGTPERLKSWKVFFAFRMPVRIASVATI
jgi:hypothetical protein